MSSTAAWRDSSDGSDGQFRQRVASTYEVNAKLAKQFKFAHNLQLTYTVGIMLLGVALFTKTVDTVPELPETVGYIVFHWIAQIPGERLRRFQVKIFTRAALGCRFARQTVAAQEQGVINANLHRAGFNLRPCGVGYACLIHLTFFERDKAS